MRARQAKMILACTALTVLAAACRPDTLALNYDLEPGSVLSYRMDARAEARWDIEGEGEGSYSVSFDLTETVTSGVGGAATVLVEMIPVQIEEEGLLAPPPERRSFTLRLGSQGDVLDILEVEGVEAEALDPDDLTFLGTYRPPLPEERVRLGESWSTTQDLEVGGFFQEMVTEGSLDALRVGREGQRLARLSYESEGPLVWTTELSEGVAELAGSATTETQATLDIDDGSLEIARSVTTGTFDVQLEPETGQVPVTGSLTLDLELEVRRASPEDLPPEETQEASSRPTITWTSTVVERLLGRGPLAQP